MAPIRLNLGSLDAKLFGLLTFIIPALALLSLLLLLSRPRPRQRLSDLASRLKLSTWPKRSPNDFRSADFEKKQIVLMLSGVRQTGT